MKKHHSIEPMHPGALLREDVLPALGVPKARIAAHLGVSRQSLYEVLNEERAISPEMAVRLGKLCGNGPALWLTLQNKYDLYHAAQQVKVSSIPTLEARA